VTTTDQKERGEDQEPSFWPSFTRADTRLFIVTFAGDAGRQRHDLGGGPRSVARSFITGSPEPGP